LDTGWIRILALAALLALLAGGCTAGGLQGAPTRPRVAFSYDLTVVFIAYPPVVPQVDSGAVQLGHDGRYFTAVDRVDNLFTFTFARDASWFHVEVTPQGWTLHATAAQLPPASGNTCDNWIGSVALDDAPAWSLAIDAGCATNASEFRVHGSWQAAP
jgi:hypothetical protein